MGKTNPLQLRKDAYVVRLTNWETRKEFTKRFTFSQFNGGKPEAYRAAMAYRTQCLRLPQYQPRQRQKARKMGKVELRHGVYLLFQGGGRKIFWQALKPGLPTKSFSIRTHGWERAYFQAVAAYESMTGVRSIKMAYAPPMPKRVARLLAKKWRRKRRKHNTKDRRQSIKSLRAKFRALLHARKRITTYPHGRYDLSLTEKDTPTFELSREAKHGR